MPKTLQNTKLSLQLHFYGEISLISDEITELLQFDLNPVRSRSFLQKYNIKWLVPTRTEEITPLSELYQPNSQFHCTWLVSSSCNILQGLLFGTQPHFCGKTHTSEQPAYTAPRWTNSQPLPLAIYSNFSCFIYSMHSIKGLISGVQ